MRPRLPDPRWGFVAGLILIAAWRVTLACEEPQAVFMHKWPSATEWTPDVAPTPLGVCLERLREQRGLYATWRESARPLLKCEHIID